MPKLSEIQHHLGVTADGKWGPNTATAIARAIGLKKSAANSTGNDVAIKSLQHRLRIAETGIVDADTTESLIKAFTNTKAPAITTRDYLDAAKRLGVPAENIHAAFYKESARGGYDSSGLIKILNEGQWFSRLTRGAFNRIIPTLSYPKWTRKFYARSMRKRYQKLAEKCKYDVEAAFASCSWGGPQVMGFHAKSLGYESAVNLAFSLVQSEKAHLELFIRFIETNRLQKKLAKCRPDSRASCIDYSRAYNGSGFAKNGYAKKFSALIKRFAPMYRGLS